MLGSSAFRLVAAAVFGFVFLPVGGVFGQVGGGYQGIEPILLLNDPYFTPSAYSPYGQHWLHTTKVTYAWRLVGYDQPYTVDHNNPNRTIALIDTGIDMDHPEFGGDGMLRHPRRAGPRPPARG